MMFSFDEKYGQYDVTPVDNQFIREYLPCAKGDYVRVYLYGLMRCYFPDGNETPETTARELGLTEEDVFQAYRYWERRGLVRRTGDNPVTYVYVSLRRRALAGIQEIDEGYQIFADSLYGVFGRRRELNGSEIQTCYEWVEVLKLPSEVVIMLLRHLERVKGKNFSFATAGRMAEKMAREGVRTLEDAEEYLSRDEEIYQGTRKILRRLGKRNNPSEDQMALYRKWTVEWGFTPEAIESACAETAKGDPSMGYLDGVLRNIHTRSEGAGSIDEAGVRKERERAEELKELLGKLGKGTINDETLEWYDRLKAAWPREMIRLAARECGRTGGKPEDVEKMLSSWEKKGLRTTEDAEKYIAEFKARSELLLELRHKWGLNGRMGEKDRAMLGAWETELGFSREMILFTADYAAGAERPMAYLDKVLRACAEKGIRTPEAVEAEHQSRLRAGRDGAGKPERERNPAQRYPQRDYSREMESMEEMFARLGGGDESDA